MTDLPDTDRLVRFQLSSRAGTVVGEPDDIAALLGFVGGAA